jgi:2-polyprenyl-3-methyl-5-hydroxy-6-metoxy-1,4-benzoquinol methylase
LLIVNKNSKMTEIKTAVQKLYNTYPFPPDPLIDQPPPGYNWRWSWKAAYNFCFGRKPAHSQVRILDAGCGTGSGTDYLVHLNPNAEVTAIDLSENALAIAQERCERSSKNVRNPIASVTFQHLSIEDTQILPGNFDLINCVGVLHHLADPVKGIQALASKLAPGGLMHIFVYGELGRWEIQLMQQAIAIFQGDKKGDYQDGVKIGRQIFANLPEDNRLLKREKERWGMENQRDECFADMYVHPQEIDYNSETLFELIDSSGLEFIGFSNPQYWNIDRLIGSEPELKTRFESLTKRQQYRLIELLDPENATHYEFFLGKPPLVRENWSDDHKLNQAIPELNPCLDGWPSQCLFNYDYQIVNLSLTEFELMQKCDGKQTIGEILATGEFSLDQVRSLLEKQLLILTPSPLTRAGF